MAGSVFTMAGDGCVPRLELDLQGGILLRAPAIFKRREYGKLAYSVGISFRCSPASEHHLQQGVQYLQECC